MTVRRCFFTALCEEKRAALFDPKRIKLKKHQTTFLFSVGYAFSQFAFSIHGISLAYPFDSGNS